VPSSILWANTVFSCRAVYRRVEAISIDDPALSPIR
jgi:hypothetical protein